MSAKLANGQKVVVRNQLSTLPVNIGTSWGPAIDPRDEFVKGGGEETGNVYGGWRRGNRPSGSADGDVGYCVGGWLAV